MGGSFTVFQSAVSGLQANSQAISIAANNIANVNTPGYSRQEAILQSETPQTIGGVELGRGVRTKLIRRIFDAFAELQLRNAASSRAELDSTASHLKRVEAVLNEVGFDGIASAVSELFNSFGDIANDPESTTARVNALSKATTLVDRFNMISSKLEDSRALIDLDLRDKVNVANGLIEEIYDLNQKISSDSGDALSLRDERMSLTRDLAELIDVNVVETSDGSYQVYGANGMMLVSEKGVGVLSTQADDDNDGHFNILFTVGDSAAVDITTRIAGGSLKGLVTVRDTEIPDYLDSLNEMAFELARQVNDIHQTGYDLEGNTGNLFFSDLAQVAAGTDRAIMLRNSSDDLLGIDVSDTITIQGTVGAAFSTTMTVSETTTLSDIASAMQTAIRAATGASGTETVVVDTDGSLLVTAGAAAITNLKLVITGNATFNTAFTFDTPITAGGGTGDSDTLSVAGDAAANLAIDADVDGLPRAIAASDSAGGLPGGNVIATQIGALQSTNVSFSTGSATFVKFYGDLLATIGGQSQSYENRFNFADNIFRQSSIQREQISGVSLEEEQMNLLKYQAAFSATAKLVSVAQEIFDRLVNIGL